MRARCETTDLLASGIAKRYQAVVELGHGLEAQRIHTQRHRGTENI
jgi:hypothetical protein